MDADTIYRSFIQPELQALNTANGLTPERSLALALWVCALNLAQIRSQMEQPKT